MTTKFCWLAAHVDLADQLVSRYIEGMKQQFQDSLNFFYNVNVSEAYQRALHLEKTVLDSMGVVVEQTPHPPNGNIVPPPLHN